jgi:hypothetical protein
MSMHTEALESIIDHAHAMAVVAWRLGDRALAKAWASLAVDMSAVLDRYETCEMVHAIARKESKKIGAEEPRT